VSSPTPAVLSIRAGNVVRLPKFSRISLFLFRHHRRGVRFFFAHLPSPCLLPFCPFFSRPLAWSCGFLPFSSKAGFALCFSCTSFPFSRRFSFVHLSGMGPSTHYVPVFPLPSYLNWVFRLVGGLYLSLFPFSLFLLEFEAQVSLLPPF